jgi:hypothetical protein
MTNIIISEQIYLLKVAYMKIVKPVFILGTGRCGSTAFHRVFSRHPEIAFMSSLLHRFPSKIYLNRLLMKILDIPVLKYAGRKVLPSECWNFWRRYGIGGICRDPGAEDLTPARKDQLREVLPLLLTRKRHRLIIKLTGWPRIRYFREAFPDARFIHIIRDGRAVANSFLNVGWWQGWMGPENWGFGPLPAGYMDEWEKHGRSFVALAGIEWKIIMDRFRDSSKGLDSSQYMEMRYEDLCSEPVERFREVSEFCSVGFPRRFESEIRNSPPFSNRNFKWRDQLTGPQQDVLTEVLTGHLRDYGYSV